MPDLKVIVVEGKEKEVSITAYTLLYRFTFYSQKYRETNSEQHRKLMLLYEKKSIEFLKNPLVKIVE